MDVVVVTLGKRPSLRTVIASAKQVLPDPHFIFITEKGIIGDLRNKGLAQCTSDLVCFLDDDVLINKDWFQKCLRALENPNVYAVAGRVHESYTMGCTILKRTHYPKGAFSPLDKISDLVVLEDALCDHLDARNLQLLKRSWYWMFYGFYTESKVGFYHSPRYAIEQFTSSLRRGLPDYAASEILWIIKSLWSIPFAHFSSKKHRHSPSFGETKLDD